MKKSSTRERAWDLLKQSITGWSDSTEEELSEYAMAAEFDELADGTTVGEVQELYYVTVYYRDPLSSSEMDSATRQWRHEVCAPDEQRAQAAALKDFRTIEGLSNARWRREIVSVVVLASSDAI